jgi:membrane-associated phospholipid phosphatase
MVCYHFPMKAPLRPYFYALAAAITLCLLAVWLIDDSVARFFAERAQRYHANRFAIGATLLIVPITMAAAFLKVQAVKGKSLSRISEAIMLSGLSAVIAFMICDFLLKPLFGRQTVYYYLARPRLHGFLFMQGSYRSSFPSGHTVIAAAIITVMWQYYPRWAFIYVAVLLTTSMILIAGEWHFVSDIIGGAFLGAAVARIAMDTTKRGKSLTFVASRHR